MLAESKHQHKRFGLVREQRFSSNTCVHTITSNLRSGGSTWDSRAASAHTSLLEGKKKGVVSVSICTFVLVKQVKLRYVCIHVCMYTYIPHALARVPSHTRSRSYDDRCVLVKHVNFCTGKANKLREFFFNRAPARALSTRAVV